MSMMAGFTRLTAETDSWLEALIMEVASTLIRLMES